MSKPRKDEPKPIRELFEEFMGDTRRRMSANAAPEIADAMMLQAATAWAHGVGAVLMREGTPADMMDLAQVLAEAANRRSWTELDQLILIDHDEP